MALNLLDTSAVIDLSKGFEPTTSWLQQQTAAGEELFVTQSAIRRALQPCIASAAPRRATPRNREESQASYGILTNPSEKVLHSTGSLHFTLGNSR